jgi:hypothetical protein
MVVVMQLNVCHESPVTQSDGVTSGPQIGVYYLIARQEGQRGGAVSRLWHNALL